MFNQFKEINANINEIINRDFIWVSEYLNGSLIYEYDKEKGIENNFYSIDKNQLLRFGLIGHGMRLYYETFNGSFFLNDKKVDVIYKDENGTEYNLTNNNSFYNDIIQYKDCSSVMNTRKLNNNIFQHSERIESYNFGYKHKLSINGVNFSYRLIVKIPYNQPVRLNIKIVADKTMNGSLIIRKNNYEDIKYYAPIKANNGGELDWVVI